MEFARYARKDNQGTITFAQIDTIEIKIKILVRIHIAPMKAIFEHCDYNEIDGIIDIFFCWFLFGFHLGESKLHKLDI